jgi:glycosyltransferase involved in cell wall biosynthesis
MTAPDAPRVSVIVPAYNYGRFVGDALRSILTQSLRELEVIVVDDGSTDETPEVLAQFTDPRLSVHRTHRVGVSRVRTLGASLARAPLVAWLDADDMWRPGYLERQVAVLDAEPDVAFSFTNFVRTQDGVVLPETQFDHCTEFRTLVTRAAREGDAKVIEGDTFAALAPFAEMPCWLQATVHRKSALVDLQPTAGGMEAEDLYLQLQVYTRGGAAFIEEPLVEVRRHGANSYSNGDQIREGVLSVVQQVERNVSLTPAQRAVLRRRIGGEFCRRGYRYFWAHDARRAASYYAQALRWPGTRRGALLHLALLPALPLLPRREPEF